MGLAGKASTWPPRALDIEVGEVLKTLLHAQVYVDPEVLGHDTVTFAAGSQRRDGSSPTLGLAGTAIGALLGIFGARRLAQAWSASADDRVRTHTWPVTTMRPRSRAAGCSSFLRLPTRAE